MMRIFVANIFCFAVFGVQAAFAAGGHSEAVEHHGEEVHGNVAHHGGDAAHHAESSGGLPQLDASTFPSQLFWLAVTFAILYVIFSKKTLPDISGVLENRKTHIQSDLEAAENLKSEAEKAQQTYEESLSNARKEAAKTVGQVHEKIKAKAEKDGLTFKDKADKEVGELEKRLNKAKKDAMDDMNTIAAEVARDAAEKIVGISTDLNIAKTVVKSLNGKEAA